jgi:hypothetical protein
MALITPRRVNNRKHVIKICWGPALWIDFVLTLGCEARKLTNDRIPPNLHFQIDDCELDWTFEKDSFDYIHLRGLQGSVKDWPRLLTQAYLYVPYSALVIDESV